MSTSQIPQPPVAIYNLVALLLEVRASERLPLVPVALSVATHGLP